MCPLLAIRGRYPQQYKTSYRCVSLFPSPIDNYLLQCKDDNKFVEMALNYSSGYRVAINLEKRSVSIVDYFIFFP